MVVVGYPVQCRMFSNLLGLYPLDTTHLSYPYPPVVTTKNVSRHCIMCPVDKITPSHLTLSFQLRMIDLRYLKVIV